jgi:hypothetical protein
MQARSIRSWKSRLVCGVAAVVANTVLFGTLLSLFAFAGGNGESAQAQAKAKPASEVTVTSAVRKGGGV